MRRTCGRGRHRSTQADASSSERLADAHTGQRILSADNERAGTTARSEERVNVAAKQDVQEMAPRELGSVAREIGGRS